MLKSQSLKFELRPYQQDCVRTVIDDMWRHRKLGVVLPTGTGKTEIMLAIADEVIKTFKEKVMIISHMGLLVDQTGERVESRYPHLKVAYCQAEAIPWGDEDLIIGTMQSARLAYKLHRVKNLGLIIVDEAHMITSASYKLIVERYPDAKVVGFTATPFKDNKLMTNYFNKISYSGSIKTFIDEGYLVEPRITGIQMNSGDPEKVIVTVAELIRDKERESKTIVYMDSLANCNYLRQALQVERIDSAVITAGTTRDDRELAFSKFKLGNLNVLISVNVLTAGFDAPNTNCIIMPYRVGSASTYIQRIGRGLRPFKDKTHCQIYVFGKEPKIETNFYEKLTDKIVRGKEAKKVDDPSTILDKQTKKELIEFNWDEKFVNIFKSLKVKDAQWTLKNLLQKNFPPLLEAKIVDIHNAISARKTRLSPEEASAAQKRLSLIHI